MLLQWGILLVGLCTVGQFSFWGNYLPRVYPTHLRGTGESFAANVGGRMLGTGAALVTTELSLRMPGANPGIKLAYAAAAVGHHRLRHQPDRELLAARAQGERSAGVR